MMRITELDLLTIKVLVIRRGRDSFEENLMSLLLTKGNRRLRVKRNIVGEELILWLGIVSVVLWDIMLSSVRVLRINVSSMGSWVIRLLIARVIVTFYNCGEQGHISTTCQKPKKDQTKGRFFALSGAETIGDERLIRGM